MNLKIRDFYVVFFETQSKLKANMKLHISVEKHINKLALF
jgi:hypothetical protein